MRPWHNTGMPQSRLLRYLVLLGSLIVVANVIATAQNSPAAHIKTVWVIVMENQDWVSIRGSKSAPYINETLLPQASYADQYYNPPRVHPSLPNYLWMEAGTSFGIADDRSPLINSQSTTQHLVTLLKNAPNGGISWRTYQENISGKDCPLGFS